MILAIDVNNHVHADWHIHGDNAAAVFANRVSLMIDKCQPSRCVLAFDCEGPTWRHRLFPEYKAKRKQQDRSGVQQELLKVREHFSDTTIECVQVDEFEADDVIASIVANRGTEKVLIASSDKDCRQLLVAGQVSILRKWNGGAVEYLTAENLFHEYGLRPYQWVDYQCIVGDSSDNITGVEGMGDKAARKLLADGRLLFDVLQNPPMLTQKKLAALQEFAERYDLVRDLLTLRMDVPIDTIPI